MVRAARKTEHGAPAPESIGAGAAGGVIADLHRTIEERMMTDTAWQASSAALILPEMDGIGHRISRLAGPASLATAYAAVAIWWF